MLCEAPAIGATEGIVTFPIGTLEALDALVLWAAVFDAAAIGWPSYTEVNHTDVLVVLKPMTAEKTKSCHMARAGRVCETTTVLELIKLVREYPEC